MGSAGRVELRGSCASSPDALRQAEELVRAGGPYHTTRRSSRSGLAAELAIARKAGGVRTTTDPPSSGGRGKGFAGFRFQQRAGRAGAFRGRGAEEMPEPSGGPGKGRGTRVRVFRIEAEGGNDSPPTPPGKVTNDEALLVFRFKTIHYQFSRLRLKP